MILHSIGNMVGRAYAIVWTLKENLNYGFLYFLHLKSNFEIWNEYVWLMIINLMRQSRACCGHFQLHIQCWSLVHFVSCLIELAYSNHKDLYFKLRKQSGDIKKKKKSQWRFSSTLQTITRALPIVLHVKLLKWCPYSISFGHMSFVYVLITILVIYHSNTCHHFKKSDHDIRPHTLCWKSAHLQWSLWQLRHMLGANSLLSHRSNSTTFGLIGHLMWG
jgi:hypothetical protein